MKKIKILSIVFFAIISKVTAQSEYGTFTSIGVDKKIGKWKLEAETELRTIDYLNLINRWSIELNAGYKIAKPFTVNFGYQLMNVLDQKYMNYQWRNRLKLEAEGKKKWGDFSFSLSEGLQLTTKDDNKRIRDDGSIDTYAINPAWVWKNSFEVEYDIPKSKLSPGYEFQTYYELNNPDGNDFDKIRNTLFLKYKINKNNAFKIFGSINSELGTDEAEYSGKYILGLKYNYHF
jgi:hypothetical protein